MKLLEKKTIGNMELKNSMAFPPITTGFGAVNGCFAGIEADSVVLAVGYAPERTLVSGLQGADFEVVVVGDAATPRRILNAVHEGFHAARRIGEGDRG